MTEALLRAMALKHVTRAGWLRVGIAAPESVAAHSWGVAFLTLCLLPPHLNLARALSYATVHDLAEVIAGDITPHDGVSAGEKSQREADAMETLGRDLPPALSSLWTRYTAQADDEARFVHQLDRLDMALQAVAYADLADTQAFLVSARTAVHDPALRRLVEQLQGRISKPPTS